MPLLFVEYLFTTGAADDRLFWQEILHLLAVFHGMDCAEVDGGGGGSDQFGHASNLRRMPPFFVQFLFTTGAADERLFWTEFVRMLTVFHVWFVQRSMNAMSTFNFHRLMSTACQKK
jgi:hypothetical protein